MKNTQKGFTLVELLVVIAILAILAGVGVAGYSAFIGRANDSNAATEAHQIQSAIDAFTMAGEDYVLSDTYTVKKVDVDATTAVKMEYRVFTSEGQVDVAVDEDIKSTTKDFKDMPGTLTITADGVLVYTGKDATAGIEIK